jgi:hypothetical protein
MFHEERVPALHICTHSCIHTCNLYYKHIHIFVLEQDFGAVHLDIYACMPYTLSFMRAYAYTSSIYHKHVSAYTSYTNIIQKQKPYIKKKYNLYIKKHAQYIKKGTIYQDTQKKWVKKKKAQYIKTHTHKTQQQSGEGHAFRDPGSVCDCPDSYFHGDIVLPCSYHGGFILDLPFSGESDSEVFVLHYCIKIYSHILPGDILLPCSYYGSSILDLSFSGELDSEIYRASLLCQHLFTHGWYQIFRQTDRRIYL